MEIQTIQENTDMYIEELIELCYINTMGKLFLFDDSLEMITDDENYYTESNEYSFSDDIHDYIEEFQLRFISKTEQNLKFDIEQYLNNILVTMKEEKTKSLLYLLKSKKLIYDNIRLILNNIYKI